jgi:hypothetical protein
MEISKQGTHWKQWQISLFRFFFVFLSLLSLIAYDPIIQIFDVSWEKQTAFFGHLKGFAGWMDTHFFHLNYLPTLNSPEFSDTHFGSILTLTILIIAIATTIFWTFLDKTRSNYNRFYYWFCNYLAYYIFLAMMPYAIEKIIPVQAHFPNAIELYSRLGDFQKWQLLFLFLGASPTYCMLCGWIEFIAAALLLFNRTRVIGGLLMVVALIQVVSFNIFYNNSIILLSSILFLSTLFVIGRAIPKLFNILIRLKPVSLAEYRYRLTTPWKKYLLIFFCFLPVWKLYSTIKYSSETLSAVERNQHNQKFYKVTMFKSDNDTIAPLITDTISWKYICFLDYSAQYQSMIKYNTGEKREQYQIKWDTLKRTITVLNQMSSGDDVFNYKKSSNGNLQLIGKWHGKNTTMSLMNLPVDSMTLVKDKFTFMQEDQ